MTTTGNHPPTAAEVDELVHAADTVFFAMRKARSAGADRDGGLSLPQLTMLEPLAAEPELPVGRLRGGRGRLHPDGHPDAPAARSRRGGGAPAARPRTSARCWWR